MIEYPGYEKIYQKGATRRRARIRTALEGFAAPLPPGASTKLVLFRWYLLFTKRRRCYILELQLIQLVIANLTCDGPSSYLIPQPFSADCCGNSPPFFRRRSGGSPYHSHKGGTPGRRPLFMPVYSQKTAGRRGRRLPRDNYYSSDRSACGAPLCMFFVFYRPRRRQRSWSFSISCSQDQ